MSCNVEFDTVYLKLGSIRNVSLNLVKALNEGELVESVTEVEDVTYDGQPTGDLSIGNTGVNTVAYTDQRTGETVAVGKAVQFSITTSSSVARVYKIKVTYVTDSTPTETVVDFLFVSFD